MKIFYLRQLKTANLHLETAIACQSWFNPPRQASRPGTRPLFLPCPHAGAWADDASDGGYYKVSHLEMSLIKAPDIRNPNNETYPKNQREISAKIPNISPFNNENIMNIQLYKHYENFFNISLFAISPIANCQLYRLPKLTILIQ